jgi:hypothetical protein
VFGGILAKGKFSLQHDLVSGVREKYSIFQKKIFSLDLILGT